MTEPTPASVAVVGVNGGPHDQPFDAAAQSASERKIALDAIAAEVRACRRCPLSAGRTQAVPGEGDPDTEVVFVGKGPGFNEDRK
ncbi:MAG: hypothetical protein HY263_02010, partial [Chloroflexi bacterium]|nr:hypothetical protein [Chloroflexota bacterium]